MTRAVPQPTEESGWQSWEAGHRLLRYGWVLQPQGCAFCCDLLSLSDLPIHHTQLNKTQAFSVVSTRTFLSHPTVLNISVNEGNFCLPFSPVAEQIE